MRRAVVTYPIVLVCLLSMVSCGFYGKPSQDKAVSRSVETDQPRPSEPQPLPQKKVEKKRPQKPAAPVLTELDQHRILLLNAKDELTLLLENDAAEKALSVAMQQIKRGFSEQELAREYLQAINTVIELGCARLDGNQPDLAGPLLLAALNSYPQEADLASAVLLSTEELKIKLNLCAKKLMAQGLIAYRAGDLGSAIGLWEKILIFAPQHQPGLKAIQTASSQLVNLKKITDGN